MIYYLHNNLFRRVLTLKIFFFFINLCINKSYADILSSYDLMPFDNNLSIIEFNLTKYSNELLPNSIGIETTNSLKLSKSSIAKLGFLSSGYNKYGLDLQYVNTEFKTKYSDEHINPLSINFTLINPNYISLFQCIKFLKNLQL